ncbi:unnamed protein product [Durusdinium trenchii]|uniref:Uncharacterized protein n=1 Tax=Durusdinium trenchii TaxID=1381693 RepID=A0ABP0PNC1_9DINO
MGNYVFFRITTSRVTKSRAHMLPSSCVVKARRLLGPPSTNSKLAVASSGEDEQDARWDFIISNGERDKENLKQMQILTILEDLLPHLRGHSLWLLGESGVGKTPLARILSMMFSQYHGGNGQFRSAPEFDFFRGIFFDKATPAIFDDGEIGNETIKKKKAFLDVGDSETILKERWTAAKFVLHQLRIVVDNQYNPEGQEGDVDGVFSAEVSHKSFMKLVRPAVGYIANADAMAILKRAAFIVFAEKYIYFRPPTEKHVKVQRVFWTNSNSKDILLPDCKPTLKNWKNGGPQPDSYSASVAWETEWLKELFRRHDHPVRPASPACPATPLTSTPGLDALLRTDGALPAAPASSRPASSSLSIPHPAPALLVGVPKLEPAEHPDAHAWLATATRGDPVDVDTDRASAGPGCQNGFKDVCLIMAMQNIGLPVVCDQDGPFSISYGNSLPLPFGVQLCQKHCRKSLPDGSYIVHDKDMKHFFALQHRKGLLLKKDGEVTSVVSVGVAMDMLSSDQYTFYYLRRQSYSALMILDAVGDSSPQTFTCPLSKCVCEGYSGSLIYHLSVDVVLYDLDGPRKIVHVQKNCTSRSCRASYGYNYRWEAGKKVNVLGMKDFQDNILFVNSKKAFSLKYIQYHEELLFRGHLSSAVVSCAYHVVHGDSQESILQNFDKLHASALFYYMAVREFKLLDLHQEIMIEQEIQDTHLDLYDSFCHSSTFPPHKRQQVKTLVLDGNQKLKMQCDMAPMKRAGRPRKSEHTTGHYTNGWMLACDPKSGRIISLQVFSWFRNFTPIINEMRAHRHKFFLLLLSKRHNESIEGGNIRYLHPIRLPNLFKNAKSVSYLYGKKSNTKNAIGKPSSGNKMVMKGKSMKSKSMKYKK